MTVDVFGNFFDAVHYGRDLDGKRAAKLQGVYVSSVTSLKLPVQNGRGTRLVLVAIGLGVVMAASGAF